MPSSYTHHRFGQAVRARLTGEARAAVETYPELYLIGLHGPDLLFYYRGYGQNPVNRLGYGLHDRPGAEFFTRAARVLARHPGEPAYLACACGLLCHFVLDSRCHPCVEAAVASAGVGHIALETELDRTLMLADGLDPVRTPLTRHVRPTVFNAHVARAFFAGVTTLRMQESLRWMKLADALFLAPGRGKRAALRAAAKALGQEPLTQLVVGYAPDPACAGAVAELTALYEGAVEPAARLCSELAPIARGERALDPAFAVDFGGRLHE